MSTTAHSTLFALTFVREHAPKAQFLAVPVAGEALTGPDDLIPVRADKGAEHRVAEAYWGWTVDRPLPYDTPGILVLDYMYRDAANHKSRRSISIKGPFSRLDIAILMGALHVGDDESFIPHQIGLDDLQAESGQEPDYEGDDHVWHTVEALGWREMGRADLDWNTLRPVFLNRAEQGYDLIAAMQHLDPY